MGIIKWQGLHVCEECDRFEDECECARKYKKRDTVQESVTYDIQLQLELAGRESEHGGPMLNKDKEAIVLQIKECIKWELDHGIYISHMEADGIMKYHFETIKVNNIKVKEK